MADVKWIKIVTDIFDDEKILLIEQLPEGESIIVIWFKLLCLAGKLNSSGVLIMNNKIAYTDKMLSTIFRRKESTVQLALNTFVELGMIEVIEGVITIPNWGKHQNLDQLEKKKEYMREYMVEYRKKQNKIACKTNSKTNGKANVSFADIDIEKEIDKEKEIEGERDKETLGKERNIIALSDAEKPHSSEPYADVSAITLNDGTEWLPTQKDFEEYQRLYPAVDVPQQFNKMRAWCLSNPTKRKTIRGVKKFVNGWLAREQDDSGRRSYTSRQGSGYIDAIKNRIVEVDEWV